jgi:dipeptidyl aminopeptidase/acylaminoacyl peptidase/thiol-disulfide isomerase/thioredoxin
MSSFTRRFLAAAFITLAVAAQPFTAAAVPAGEKPDSTTEKTEERFTRITDWLVLSTVPVPLPAFHDESKKKFDAAWLLGCDHLDMSGLIPVKGAVEGVPGFGDAVWSVSSADTGGVALSHEGSTPGVTWLAAWVEVPRWMKVDLKTSSSDPFELFIDGKSVVKDSKGGGKEKSGNLELQKGKHLILAKAVYVPADTARAWNFDAKLAAGKDFDAVPIISLDPTTGMTLAQVIDVPGASDIDVSPDGSLVIVNISRMTPPEGKRERWIEIRSLPNGELVSRIMDTQIGSTQWIPGSRKISYVSGGHLRSLDMDTGQTETLVEELAKDFGGYDWSPKGDWIIYSMTENPEENKTGVKRHLGVYDRTDYGRSKSSLHIMSIPGGVSRQIAAGKYGSYVYDIHPDGYRVLIGRSWEDMSERPFGTTELLLMDIRDQSVEQLFEGNWLGSAHWSPDGDRILVTAGPSTFGDSGKDLPEGVIPNDYDTQVYIFDPETKEVKAITRDFDPAVNRAIWAKFDGKIYLVAEDTEYVKLFRYDPKKEKFTELDLGVEVIGSGDIAETKPVGVFTGSGATYPQRIYSVELNSSKPKARTIDEPAAELFRHVKIGKVEPWRFKTSAGYEIVGRIHYPPDFDAEKTYPCIVYYYGGTSPVDRTFGGRYPKNLWAAMGYVVYVLQPSGATGFGQEWSARHVNEWGIIVADEIIEGTKRFLEAHQFVDPGRVGCIGASFGGFMTQLLVTRTDIYAAAISHAGISMIPSYWGEGYWGYSYNAVAAAESYPWNNPKIYVEQSPLFHADRIVTPLLLLHGGSDTNVPPGESEQMYTALKILGREVEYLRFAEQNHFILDYRKRAIWNDAIISWFDKYLKKEPEWWDSMYPPIDEAQEPGGLEATAVEIEGRGTVLFGNVTRADIATHISDWDTEYFEYEPDGEIVTTLEDAMLDVDIKIVFGTWCSDSRREVPRLWKILEEIGYPVDEVEMMAVGSSRFTAGMGIDRKLLDWSDSVKKYYATERVATIILYRDGEELGRIEETPEGTLEEDLLKITAR